MEKDRYLNIAIPILCTINLSIVNILRSMKSRSVRAYYVERHYS